MSSVRTRGRRGLVIAGSTAVISGIAVFLNGYGVRSWTDPVTYTTVKNLVAAALLAVAAAPLLRRAAIPRTPGVWARLAVIGVIGGGVPFVLFFQGLSLTDPARAAFIHKSLIVWVALLAAPLLSERLDRFHLTAIGLLVVGQMLLAPAGSMGWGRGDWMILGATLLWAAEVILVKRLLPSVDPVLAGSARLGIGAIVLLGWTLSTGGLSAIGAAGPASWAWVAVTGGVLALFVAGWYSALALAPATDVTAMLVPGALITAALSTGLKGAALPNPVGVAVLVLGIIVLVAAGRRSAAE
jgi:drug/metabolite transporter (DMT)-like permease